MSLPASDPRASDRRTPDGAAASAEAFVYRVLVVDDDRDCVEVLAELLQMAGHVVRTATDSAGALAAAAEFRPDAALLDIGLPIMDGYQLARNLRAIPGLENLKLVAVTGYARKSKRQAGAPGFDAYVVKPLETVRIISILQRLLSTR